MAQSRNLSTLSLVCAFIVHVGSYDSGHNACNMLHLLYKGKISIEGEPYVLHLVTETEKAEKQKHRDKVLMLINEAKQQLQEKKAERGKLADANRRSG